MKQIPTHYILYVDKLVFKILRQLTPTYIRKNRELIKKLE